MIHRDTNRAKPVTAANLVGGLDTKSSPTQVALNASPDLQNVVLSGIGAEKRGGFTPLIRQQPRGSAVRNYGFHGKALEPAGSTTVDYLTVPGALYAGHREVWETDLADAGTIEFFFRIDDLTTTHGGNNNPNTGAGQSPAGPTPFDIQFRPIISKGPVKKTFDTVSGGPQDTTNQITWQTGAPHWGGASGTHAMPFAIYLEDTSPGNGLWVLRFERHLRRDTGVWASLRLSLTGLEIAEGVTYHIICTWDDTNEIANMRAGRVRGPLELPVYVETTSFYPWSVVNYTPSPTPIQVFDIPQEFLDAPTAQTPTRPPGRNMAASLASGGYFHGCKRFEGAIDDITIHAGDLLTGNMTALDRSNKYDAENLPSTVRQYWSMNRPGVNYVEEVTGQGNHLYFLPRGPVHDDISGSARPGGSWWFNGCNSYALVKLGDNVDGVDGATDDGNPNWRYRSDRADGAAFQTAVRTNKNYGIYSVFWPDSEFEPFEQVVMEIHSVLRLAISPSGTIVGYARNQTNNATSIVQNYHSNRVESTTTVKAGRRYNVVLMRTTTTNPADTLQLFVNGALEAEIQTLPDVDPDSTPISGVTVGMGSFRPTSYTTDTTTPIDPDTTRTGSNEEINTDHRSGFVGRIEEFGVLGGTSIPPTYKDPDTDDGRLIQSALWESPLSTAVNRELVVPDDPRDLPSGQGGTGIWLAPAGDDQLLGIPLRYCVDSIGSSYALAYTTPHNHNLADFSEGGADQLYARAIFTYYVLGRWVLSIDDRDLRDQGRYLPNVELRTHGSSKDYNEYRHVHLQGSEVTDDFGCLGALQKRCVESDQMTEADADYFQRQWQHRLRPYSFSHPTELGPKWVEGLAWGREDANELTLMADWENEQSGERFVVTAAGRQVYWARQPWRRSSPFLRESGTLVPWSMGERGSSIRVPHTNANQALILGTQSVELSFWCYPQSLDLTRTIAYKGNFSQNSNTAPEMNFWVHTRNGALNVIGVTGATNATTYWMRQGTLVGGTYIPEVTLQVGEWNHVILRMNQNGTFSCVVNGKTSTMVLEPGFDTPAGAQSSGETDDLYLMGVPQQGYNQTTKYTVSATLVEWVVMSWQGYLTDFKLSNSLSTSNDVPQQRATDDANTYHLLPMTEGSGWTVTETASNITGGDGTMSLDELVLIGEGLDESSGRQYEWAAFRNQLYITNGRSYPQCISFSRFSDPKGPFTMRRLGMQPPHDEGQVTIEEVAGSGLTAGVYAIWMVFRNLFGTESEPLLLGTHTASGNFSHFRVSNLPRSQDPHVTSRRFYVSASGGGVALQGAVLPDNISLDVEVGGGTGLAVEGARRLPAPRARQIAVAEGSMWLAHLTDVGSGQNAFQVSDGAETEWWPAGKIALIDLGNGNRISALTANIGRMFLSKRDSVSQLRLVGTASLPQPSAVNTSIGLAGGVTAYDAVIFGAGDKGVHGFTGADPQYASMALEEDYRTLVDRTDDGLGLMGGAYYWPQSQYWLSVRRTGEAFAELIYVLQTDLQTVIGQTPQSPWVRMVAPKHTVTGMVLDPNTRDPILLIGTKGGQVLRYNPNEFVDGAPGTTGTLTGTADSATTTTLTLASASFDVNSSGLKGATIKITSGGTTYERVIARNTATTITWTEPITGLSGTPTFVIGGYDSFWSTRWLQTHELGAGQRGQMVTLEFEPAAGSVLTMLAQSADNSTVTTQRTFPTSGAESFSIDLARGWMEPVRLMTQNRGSYLRLRFGNSTPGQTYKITAYSLRVQPSGQRGTRAT